ncbi:MAG: Fic family protein [Prevotella sp.]|nr:Fic family protein [Prevotella sp.]
MEQQDAFLKVNEIAQKWGISTRRVRLLCSEGRIAGVVRKGNLYMIPANAAQPQDARTYIKSKGKKPYFPLLEQIDALKHQLAALRPLTAAEVDALRKVFLVDHTYNSNAIEGNTLTLKETSLVLQGMTIDQKPLKDHLEVIGYKEAFEYMEQLAREKTPLTDYEIRSIHALVLMNRREDGGRYRRVPVRIVGAQTEPVEPYLIEPMLTELIQDLQSRYATLHIVEQAALFHLRFEAIHPFIDGNGRTGRLLMNLQLIRAGLPPINIKFADKKRYYDAFDAYASTHSAKEMTMLIANYLIERMQTMINTITL